MTNPGWGFTPRAARRSLAFNDSRVTSARPESPEMAASCLSARAAVAKAATFRKSSRQSAVSRRAVQSTTRAKAVAEPPASEVKNSDIQMFEGSKRLQTQVTEIGPDTTCIRSLDWDRDRFDIEFGLENGTTYNSYVIKGADKTALVDASQRNRQLYIDTLSGVVDIKDIDYLVCSHTGPPQRFDRSHSRAQPRDHRRRQQGVPEVPRILSSSPSSSRW